MLFCIIIFLNVNFEINVLKKYIGVVKINLWDFDKYFKVFLLYVIRYEYCKLMIGYW